jgi:hypothetical protein
MNNKSENVKGFLVLCLLYIYIYIYIYRFLGDHLRLMDSGPYGIIFMAMCLHYFRFYSYY